MEILKLAAKKIVERIVFGIVFILNTNFFGRFFMDQFVNSTRNNIKEIKHNGVTLQFVTPNSLTHYRVCTFSSKEPDTLSWIDGFTKNSNFWDVGANVGLFSCYAAKTRHCRVFAFEPSVFNLEILARNIYINSLSDKASIVTFPLSNDISFSNFKMTSLDYGSALSTFGESYGQDGKPLGQIFSFNTIGISADKAIDILNIPPPDYIKIDVDGIESLILEGGENLLRNVKEVLIEINDDFETQYIQSQNYLKNAGLVMVSKRNTDLNSIVSKSYSNSYNQIWKRP
ncbi:fkbM_fam, methyltransferase, FkbM family [Candidatus Methylopumilus universalis]|uniref:FkbM family methyltransferase n=1 Tax=Candidatus Methylopumilus universalis TaxID=2588536 RepID=UPI003BEEC3D7